MGLIVRELEASHFLSFGCHVCLQKVQSSQTVPIAVGWMNKAVSILGIVVMVAKGTLTPSVSVRCRNPQPDFKETVSVNGTVYMGDWWNW